MADQASCDPPAYSPADDGDKWLRHAILKAHINPTTRKASRAIFRFKQPKGCWNRTWACESSGRLASLAHDIAEKAMAAADHAKRSALAAGQPITPFEFVGIIICETSKIRKFQHAHTDVFAEPNLNDAAHANLISNVPFKLELEHELIKLFDVRLPSEC